MLGPKIIFIHTVIAVLRELIRLAIISGIKAFPKCIMNLGDRLAKAVDIKKNSLMCKLKQYRTEA